MPNLTPSTLPAADNRPSLFLHLKSEGTGLSASGSIAGTRGHQVLHQGRKEYEGIFADWRWDGHSLTVTNDRYGFYPLFYFASRTEIAISNSIDSLLAAGAPRHLDFTALAVFLRLGYFIGSDTAFLNIRMLQPNSSLLWSPETLTISSKVTNPVRARIERPAAIQTYLELFQTAIARRGVPQAPLIVPLSGGRDSRHILMELCRQDFRPAECVTVRFPDLGGFKPETDVAAQVATAMKVPHRIVGPAPDLLFAERKKNALTNYATLEHGWYIPLSDYLNESASCTYDGMGGDVLSAGLFLTPQRHDWMLRRQYRDLFLDMQVGLTERTILELFPSPVRDHVSLDAAVNRFAAECEQHVEAPNPIGSLSFYNRTRRVASLIAVSMQPDVPFPFCPYLDNDLFDYLSSLPANMFFDHEFHSETIRLAYPEHSSLPYAHAFDTAGRIGAQRRFAIDVGAKLTLRKRSPLINRSFVLPRLAKCIFDKSYAPAAKWLGEISIYLMQLDEAAFGE